MLATYTARKAMATLVYSSADVENSATYSVVTGGTASGEEVGELSAGGSADGAVEVTSGTAGTALAGGMGGRVGGPMGGGGGPAGGFGARPGN